MHATERFSGNNLWAQMLNNPITYAMNGKQYVAAMAGLTLFVFALPSRQFEPATSLDDVDGTAARRVLSPRDKARPPAGA
ncbi:MAG: hypothetical protein FJW27_01155 [Acidimicrobiia bacterium]|nr:hypothetical protein [Acidimicrobiia bacterium]